MTVALITDGIWPFSIGGMQKHSYLLCKYLLMEGVTVHLFHTNIEHKNVELRELFDAVSYPNLISHFIEFPKSGYFPGHYLYNTYQYSNLVFQKVLALQQLKVDFYYIQGFSGWALLNKKNQLPLNSRLVLNFHGFEMFQAYVGLRDRLQYALFRPIVKAQLNKATIIHSLGGRLTDIIRQNLHTKQVSVLEIGNGIEDNWIRSAITPTTNHRIFTFIGRYARLKGLHELFAAIPRLQHTRSFQFNFIGPIPEHAQLIAPNIRYFGAVQDERIIKNVLDETDFLLVPSYTEGMPTVINEAMARGAAVIATDVGAVREQVGADNGILLNTPRVDDILYALHKALDLNSSDIDTLKQNSLAKVARKFRWSAIVKQLLNSVQHS